MNHDGRQADARVAALDVLGRVRRDGAFAAPTIRAVLSQQNISDLRERALLTELVYGVLRHQRLLDHVLAQKVARGSQRIKPDVREVLRLAAYQLLLLDRVPDYAAVDHAVELTRRRRGKAVAGFVNAVLRKVSATDLERGLPAEPRARLAVRCSLPDPLVQRFVAVLGIDETGALGQTLLKPAPLTVRTNSLKGTREQVAAALNDAGCRVELGAYSPQALRISGLGEPFASPGHLGGLWTAQDESAQLVALALCQTLPEAGPVRILDACAGLGGKTTHLAELTRGRAELVALDLNQGKLALLAEHAARLGLAPIRTALGDLRDATVRAGLGTFGAAILDAPCSGLGVLGRHPELKWRFDPGDVPRLAALQRELFAACVAALDPGAALVYSVCTTTEEEGPAQVAWALQHFRGALSMDPIHGLCDAARQDSGALRLWNHRHHTDGFFIARFRKHHGA